MPNLTLEEDTDLDGEEFELLDAVRISVVSRLFVEFLQQGGPKPHVVFRLLFAHRTPLVGGSEWRGCRLPMDIYGGLEGIFHIKPLDYADTSTSAHAAFEFGLRRTDWTVGDFIGILKYRVNLTDFAFVGGFYMAPINNVDYVDGCRDFIKSLAITFKPVTVLPWLSLSLFRAVFSTISISSER